MSGAGAGDGRGLGPAGASGSDAARAATTLEEAVRVIWERRRTHVVDRIGAIERAAGALDQAALDECLREEAHGEAHRLAGAVGSFGFAEASAMAREAEQMLAAGVTVRAADAARLGELAAGLRRALEAPPGVGP